MSDDEDDTCSCGTESFDVEIVEVLEMHLEGDQLNYLCKTTEDTEEIFDRSDLMDGANQQKLVLAFERKHPPPWDEVCMYCGGEDCEECVCEECERPCRHINGVNYGCTRHPVI